MDQALRKKIEEIISSQKVVLFMKGNPSFPQCGFSARVVEILNSLNVEFGHCDILMNEDIRMNMEEYSKWPTFPQLFVSQKIVGGCDIVDQMFQSGELKKLIEA